MALVLVLLKRVLPFNIMTLIVMVGIGVVIYGFILALTGEIRDEVNSILRILNNKRKGD